MNTEIRGEKDVLVLQGGGALGAYQAGAYEALAAAGRRPDWIAGISIGAINAALIAGNPPERRVERLHAFWDRVTSRFPGKPPTEGDWARRMFADFGAASTLTTGAPGFFKPRFPPAMFAPDGSPGALSVYDTAPLAATLVELVDFEFLNRAGPRLSVGAVDVATGNFAYFDSAEMDIGPEHIMASGALPPGLPGVTIGSRMYWDGGVVSNTPLQFVLDAEAHDPLCVFQVDLFSARGPLPRNLGMVAQREMDIRYSSRTRLTTDRFKELSDIAAAAKRLTGKVAEALRDDPDLEFLRGVGAGAPVTLVHLIHRKETFESQTKDYEFTQLSMRQHWAAGKIDVETALNHDDWKSRAIPSDGIEVYDHGRRDR